MFYYIIVLLCCLTFVSSNNGSEAILNRSQQITELLNTILDGYDNRLRPGHGRYATLVNISFFIKTFGPIKDSDREFSLDCYFRQSWKDERLKFTGTQKTLPLHSAMLEKLWKPDTYFFGGRHSYIHAITVPNKLLRLSQDGTVFYSMRVTVNVRCPMEFHFFPHDKQACSLQITSFAYNENDLRYRWQNNKAIVFSNTHMSQFSLDSWPSDIFSMRFYDGSVFSTLHILFRLTRYVGYYILQVYVPAVLVVVLSWVSFWLNRESTCDRYNLGIGYTGDSIACDTLNRGN